jgi:hypothetical protein
MKGNRKNLRTVRNLTRPKARPPKEKKEKKNS